MVAVLNARDALSARWGAPGIKFPDVDATHTASFQSERLLASDVDPSVFANQCEPGLFGLDCFRAMNEAGFSIDGYVFVGQTLRQMRPISIGETVKLIGHVRERRPVKGGMSIVDSFQLIDRNEMVVLESELTGYLVDETARRASVNCTDTLVRRNEISSDNMQIIASKRLSPNKVRTFSEDVGNIIHFDPVYAQQLGFRAPLAQGVMSAVWLISSLAKMDHVPTAFDIDLRFLRPVFWDDEAQLYADFDRDTGNVLSAQSRNAEGKATADMIVNWVQYDICGSRS